MVVGKSFVWAHLGKTGGNTTLLLFQLFPELIEYADSHDDPAKHARFTERPVEGKARALNFRRLPSWLLAFSIHKSVHGLPRHGGRGPMDSPHQMAESREPDHYLASYLEGGAISHWLRVEYLKEDFLGFISHYTEVSKERRLAAEQLEAANTSGYDRNLSHWFSDSQIASMYANNPLWAKVEQQVYSRQASKNPELPRSTDLQAGGSA